MGGVGPFAVVVEDGGVGSARRRSLPASRPRVENLKNNIINISCFK